MPNDEMRDDGAVCPHCGEFNQFEFCDGDGRLVTWWGDDGPKEYECRRCDREFFVREHVSRFYTAGKTPEEANHAI